LYGNHETGVRADNVGSTLTLTDAVVRDTESRPAIARPFPGEFGRGLGVDREATADVRRAVFSGNRELGIGVLDASATLEDVVVEGTGPRACAETTCAGFGAGHGVGGYFPGTSIQMSRFSLRDSTVCGVHIAEGTEMDISDGAIVGHAIGACLQVDGYDPDRLTDRVFYDNAVNLQTTDLPVPATTEDPIADSMP